MKILIVGAGSTGGYFGARLIQPDATSPSRASRARLALRDGLQVLSPHGNFNVKPRLVLASELEQTFDIVLVTVKAFGLAAAIEDFAAAWSGLTRTMILLVLNGMKIDDLQALRRRARDRRRLGCASTTCSTRRAASHLAPLHELIYGELDGSRSARIEALHAFMSDAGFDAQLSPRIAQGLWNKHPAGRLAVICALARGSVGEIAATDGGGDFVRAFLAEAVAVATAAGFAPGPQALDFISGVLTAPGSPLTSSMYRDLVAGERVEADQVLGDLRARARRANVATPLISAAFIQLDVYQRRLAAS